LNLQAFGLPRDEDGDEPTTQCVLWFMNDAQGEENFITKSEKVKGTCTPEYELPISLDFLIGQHQKIKFEIKQFTKDDDIVIVGECFRTISSLIFANGPGQDKAIKEPLINGKA
jgi:hypothetical protein